MCSVTQRRTIESVVSTVDYWKPSKRLFGSSPLRHHPRFVVVKCALFHISLNRAVVVGSVRLPTWLAPSVAKKATTSARCAASRTRLFATCRLCGVIAHTINGTRFRSAELSRAGSSYKKQEEATQAIKWFWEIVRAMPNEYRRRLLHFTTDSFRVSITGFSALTSFDGQLSSFTLHGVLLSESEYISSRAYFNHLTLPMYTSREKLELMLYVTLNTELYGFTLARLSLSCCRFHLEYTDSSEVTSRSRSPSV